MSRYLLIITGILLVLFAGCKKNIENPAIDSLIYEAKMSELSDIHKMKVLSDSINKLSYIKKYAELLKKIGNTKEFEQYPNTASDENNSEELGYIKGLAYSYFFEAKNLRSQFKIKEAIISLLTAKDLFEVCGDKIGEGLVDNEILMNVKFTDDEALPQLPDYKNDNSNLVKLIKIEYQAHIPLELSGRDSFDSLGIMTNLIKQLDSLKNLDSYEEMMKRHLKAKINYAIGKIYKKQSDSLYKLKEIEASKTYLDTALNYFKKSVFYDTLLQSRQPWSIFTVAKVYLDMYEKYGHNKEFLDSVQKYNYLSLFVLNNYTDFDHSPSFFVKPDTLFTKYETIRKKGYYLVQLAYIAGNIIRLDSLKHIEDKHIDRYKKISDSIFNQEKSYIEVYYKSQLEKENTENKKLIERKKHTIKIIIILIAMITFIAIVVILLTKTQQAKISALNKELQEANEKLKEEKKNIENTNKRLSEEKGKVEAINKNLRLGNIVAESISHTIGHISSLAVLRNKIDLSKDPELIYAGIQDLRIRIPYVLEANNFFKEYKNIKKITSERYWIGQTLDFDSLIKRVKFKINFKKEIYKFSPRQDRRILRQIFYNIIHNSVKQFEKEVIYEELQKYNIQPYIGIKTYKEGKSYIIEFEDNGGGIDPIFLNSDNTLNLNTLEQKGGKGLYLIHEFCQYLGIKYEYHIIEYNQKIKGTKVKLYIN